MAEVNILGKVFKEPEPPMFPIVRIIYGRGRHHGDHICKICGSSLEYRFKWFPFFFRKKTCLQEEDCMIYERYEFL